MHKKKGIHHPGFGYKEELLMGLVTRRMTGGVVLVG